ncbi:MAG: DUF1080 domain-containing protein [Chitinophagaceae bacterium]|nr:DUF1080 domain-containing protein [Chitinophagaceae bacterium]
MNFLKVIKFALPALFCFVIYTAKSQEFTNVSLNNLDAFREPGNNWVIAGDAVADYTRQHDIKAVKGEGVVVNNFTRNKQMHLYTKDEFGDIEIELDFMMAKNSNAGIYLQGRYEIQLLDSWMKLNPSCSDAGGVYLRWTPQRGEFEGTPPVMNVAKAPGLWQHLSIKFRAPRFNDKGEKIENARFTSVYFNGVLVQQEAEVTGPTGSGMYPDEKAKGPLVLQGDHGPVAFRNIKYREPVKPVPGPPRDEYWIPKSNYWNTVDPIIVTPGSKPAFIKTFLMNGDIKLTHVLSVGSPNEVNYSYDVKQGALFQVWRGKFIDVTPAWHDRGGMQLGIPLGSVISLSDAPAVAVLQNEKVAWPDSVSFDNMHNKGYVLDKKRTPTFMYTYDNLNVKDSIAIMENNEGISRTFIVDNAPDNSYCRLAEGSSIENIGGDLYAVNNKSYYIKIDKKYKPVIRQSGKGWEIIVKYIANSPVTYSLIW